MSAPSFRCAVCSHPVDLVEQLDGTFVALHHDKRPGSFPHNPRPRDVDLLAVARA